MRPNTLPANTHISGTSQADTASMAGNGTAEHINGSSSSSLDNRKALDKAVPFEVLGMIFVFAQWPSVSLVSRRFYAVSKSKAVRAHYYLQEFGKHAVLDGKLGLAGRRPQLISQDLVLMLLNLGADPRADDQWIFRHACAKGWTAVVLKILRMCLYQIPTGGIVDGAIVMRKVLGELQHIQPYSNSASSSSSRDNTIGETPGDSPLENWRGAGHPVQTTVYDRPKGAPLIDVHAEDDEALRIAAGLGHTAVVRALVDSGADVNALNSEALVLAASNRHFETAKHLIASGSSVVAEHSRALRSAVLVGDSNINCVLALLDSGATVQAMDDSCLLSACYKGDGEFPPPPSLAYLCNKGSGAMSRAELLKYSYAGVPSHGTLYNTPAIRSGMPGAPLAPQPKRQPRRYRNVSHAMSDLSVSPPSTYTHPGATPPPQTGCSSAASVEPAAGSIHAQAQQLSSYAQGRVHLDDDIAASRGAEQAILPTSPSPQLTTHIGLVRLLLSRGANVNARSGRPIIYACSRGSVRTAAILLAYGADVHVQNEEPLREAAERGHLEIIRLLLSAGSNVHVDDEAPLRSAARGGHLHVVRELIAQGAVAASSGGTLALRAAARAGWVDVVQGLIHAGADAQDREFRSWALKSRALRNALGMAQTCSFDAPAFV